MQKVLKKLNQAVELIKKKDLKKKGRNTFSKYDYYTPEQITELTTEASHKVKIYPKFDLIRNELGIYGKLTIFDLDSDESVVFEMASAIPEIKATNISQQLGGAMTYTKRYLLTNAFDIADNNLDFDTDKPQSKKIGLPQSKKIGLPQSLKTVISNLNTVEDIEKLWKNNKELRTDKEFIELLSNKKKELTTK